MSKKNDQFETSVLVDDVDKKHTTTRSTHATPQHSATTACLSHQPGPLSLNNSFAHDAATGDGFKLSFAKQEGEGGDTTKPVSCAAIVKDLLQIAAPASISVMMSYVPGTVMLSYVGTYLGADALAGASVGLFTLNLLLYPLFGLSYAVDTLVSQEYGRDPSSDYQGVILQRGLLINLIALIPCAIAVWFREAIFALMYPPDLAYGAAEFTKYTMVFLATISLTTTIGKFLSNQRLPHLVTISVSSVVITGPILQNYLVPLYGLHGAMLAMGFSGLIELLLICVFTLSTKQTRKTLGTLRLFGEVTSDWAAIQEHIRLALPSSAFVALESCAFDVNVLLAGALSATDGAAWSVVLNVLMIMVSFPGGVVVAVTACLGSAIGANKPETAKRYAIAAVLLAALLAAINDFAFLTFFDWFLSFFTSDPTVVRRAHHVKYVAALLHFIDCCQFIFQGIFSGAGKNDQGALILMGSLWFIGTPVSYYAPSWLHLSKANAVCGVIGGLALGLAVELPMMIYAVAKWDWQVMCDECNATEEEEEDGDAKEKETEMSKLVKPEQQKKGYASL